MASLELTDKGREYARTASSRRSKADRVIHLLRRCRQPRTKIAYAIHWQPYEFERTIEELTKQGLIREYRD